LVDTISEKTKFEISANPLLFIIFILFID